MTPGQLSILLTLLRMATDIGFTVADLTNKSKDELIAMLDAKEAERAAIKAKLEGSNG